MFSSVATDFGSWTNVHVGSDGAKINFYKVVTF